MASKKYKITQLQQDNSLLELRPETDADIVNVEHGTGHYEGTATNVQSALEEVYNMAMTGGVTGVKGNEESSYRTGNVNLTPANIGAVAANSAITGATKTKITYDSKGLVTSGADLEASDIPSLTLSKISDAGTAAAKAFTTSVTSGSSDLVTSGAVYTAIDNLPEPMVFKGTVGSSGTVEWDNLPSASSSNEGYVYKVITAHATTPICEVGDTIISNATEWVVIPSGDEPSGTVTSVAMTVPTGLSVSGSPITSSGTLAVTFASGYSIPTTSDQTAWSNKQNALDTQTAYSAKGTSTKVPQITTNTLGQVTGITEVDISFPAETAITIASATGNGNAITSLSASGHTITPDKGTTFLTGNQTITLSGDVSGSGATSITATLSATGVTAGTYSAVTVDTKGRVSDGGQIIEVGSTGQSTPSSSLAVGGLFFQEL